jgi:hypothetical protein
VSERLHGVLRADGSTQVHRRAVVEHLLAGIEAIPITEPGAQMHAQIWAGLGARVAAEVGVHEHDPASSMSGRRASGDGRPRVIEGAAGDDQAHRPLTLDDVPDAYGSVVDRVNVRVFA